MTARLGSIRVVARPWPRQERRAELAARDEADDKRAKTQSLVHMKREHRHCEPDHQKGHENNRHDRQQPRAWADFARSPALAVLVDGHGSPRVLYDEPNLRSPEAENYPAEFAWSYEACS